MSYKTCDIAVIAEHLKKIKERGGSAAVLVGAGMSLSAKIPLASGIVSEMKRQYPQLIKDCKKETYPEFMSRLTPVERRDFIGSFVDNAKINLAHLYLGALVKEKYIDRILTTNFDPLIIRSLALYNLYPAVYDFAASQAFIPGESAQLSVFYLHGQRDGFVLLNTQEEMNKYSEKIKSIFQDVAPGRCWIVIGYSGENDPVFERLAEVGIFQKKLFWIGNKDNEPKQHVLDKILSPPEKFGFFVKGCDADSFFINLAKALQLPEPQIISKPFSHLKEAINTIAEYSVDDQITDLTKETKTWIDTAIKGFEEGKGFKNIKEAKKKKIDADELVRKARDIWVNRRFNQIDKIMKNVLASKKREAIEYISYALNSWGIELADQGRLKGGKESEDLFKQSMEKYEQAIRLKPDNYQAISNMGNDLLDLAKFKSGKEAEALINQSILKYKQSLKINKNNSITLHCLGNALSDLATMKTGEESEKILIQSIENLKKAYKQNQEDPGLIGSWGSSLLRIALLQNQQSEKAETFYNQSIEKFEQALKMKPNQEIFLNNLGVALEGLAEMKKGKEADVLFDLSMTKYEMAIKVKPDYTDPLCNWGSALIKYAKRKGGTEAETYYTQALEKLKKVEEIKEGIGSYDIACVHAQKGNVKEALIWLEKGLKLNQTPSRKHILDDTDLNNLKNIEEFKRIVDQYRAE